MTQLGMQDPIVQLMQRYQIPLTRDNWIALAWPEMPEEWVAEHEEEIPDFLRDPQLEDSEESSPMLSREPIQDPARGVLLRAMEKDASEGAASGSILRRLPQAIRRVK
jgi:hypothetical protein